MITAVSGAAVITGVFLPWMTFYAGLQTVSGVRGAYGKTLLAAGIVLCVLAAWRVRAERPWLRGASAVVSAIVLVTALVLLARANQMTHQQSAMMMIPGIGVGLWVIAAAGAAGVVANRRW